MTELEVRAGDELERQLARYARLRLDPSPGQAKRARSALMEAAWRQRLAPPATERARDEGAASPATVTRLDRARTPFRAWSQRRLAASLAAAVIAGLMVGTTSFAATRAGGPLYDVRVAYEELTLPTGAEARIEAELALAQGRLAEIVDASAKRDARAVAAAVGAYLRTLTDLDQTTGAPADRALAAVQIHRQVLLDVLGRAPEAARSGLENAIERSGVVEARLRTVGTSSGGRGGTSGGAGNGSGSGNGSGGNGGQGGNGNGNGAGTGAGNGNGGQGGKGGKPGSTGAPAKGPGPARTPAPQNGKPERTPPVNPDPPAGGRP